MLFSWCPVKTDQFVFGGGLFLFLEPVSLPTRNTRTQMSPKIQPPAKPELPGLRPDERVILNLAKSADGRNMS